MLRPAQHRFFILALLNPVRMLSNKMNYLSYLLIVIIILLGSCLNKNDSREEGEPLFTLLSAEQTHVDFANNLTEGVNTNVLIYEYFYNGGGVAVGDVNNDGLQDIYFTANMTDNKLYLNKGKMQFEDVTAMANVAGRPGPWKTGVTM